MGKNDEPKPGYISLNGDFKVEIDGKWYEVKADGTSKLPKAVKERLVTEGHIKEVDEK